MKQTKNTKILYFIFLVTVFLTIWIYIEHATIEINAHQSAVSETKKTKTLSEAIFFYAVGIGYVILTILIFVKPQSKIPYIALIIGTIAVVVFYYISRIYPIPVPFTDIVIRDVTMDWRDVVTKIAQQILVIPIAMLLMRIHDKEEFRSKHSNEVQGN